MPTAISELLTLLDEAFQRRAWHGTNLLGAIRGLTVDAALWRPAPSRHNIWELIVHAAYWKYAVTRRLTGGRRGSFPLQVSNWFPRDGGSAAELASEVRLLKTCHADLLKAVAQVKPGQLTARPTGSKHTRGFMIRGAAAHDLYHAGQIQLLKALGR